MKFSKNVMMLTLTALLTQTNTFAMVPTEEESVEQVEKDAKGILADIRAYKKCRKSEQGCPEDLISRLKRRGAYIGLGAATLAAAAGAATLGVVGSKKLEERKWRGPWGKVYENLKAMFGFEYSEANEEITKTAWKGEKISLDYVNTADKEAVKAAVFIAEKRKHIELANQLKDAWMTRVRKSISVSA